jgi:ABC-type amino acid transport substrate-binding protein
LALVLAAASPAGARTLDAIKQRGRLVVCANPNALPFSSKSGDRPGFELELQTIPFTFEDEIIEAVGKGDLDVALVTPATIGYYNLLHKYAQVTSVRDDVSMPELHWEVAVGMRKADDALVAAVNTALERMLADGIVSRIYASYGIDQSLPRKP